MLSWRRIALSSMATAAYPDEDKPSRKDIEACRDELLKTLSAMNASDAKAFYEKLKRSGPWGSGKAHQDWLASRQFAAMGFEVMLKSQG